MKKTKWRRLMSAAVSAFMLTSMLPMYASAADPDSSSAPTEDNLPVSVEYQKVTDTLTDGGTFTIVSSDSSDKDLRIVHLTNGTTKLDRCRVNTAGDTLTPTDCEMSQYAGTHAHAWTISAVADGYTVKSETANGGYININAGSAQAGTEAQTLRIEETAEDGLYTISRTIGDTTYYLAYTSSGWSAGTEAYPVYLYEETEVQAEILPNGSTATGTTAGQPFASGTGGSANFRIPSLITLDDGSLLAAIDARWNHAGDACALDTILSKSEDGGKTWTYSFPNYFNDSTDAKHSYATAFIDPAMIQGNDGTIYLLADLFPGGVALNTTPKAPLAKSGYEEIGGEYRLVLYASPLPENQTAYTHYVGDFGADGFAPVIDTEDSGTDYYVDQWYYLYNANKEKIYCAQLGSSKYVQQNVFYYNADLHVTAATYLWLVTSTDGGETWSAPSILNEQVRTGDSSDTAKFYGVGPGRGLAMSTGRIVFPCYTFYNADGNSSVIYSDDNGKTWERGEDLSWQTSEATVVEADGRLYMFARHGGYAVSTDGGETWSDRQDTPGANIHTGCQINAIVYSKLIDGKTAILLSCPTGGSRANGKIYTGLVQENGSINWEYDYSVTANGGYYAYSCLTELSDGSVGLLYENAGSSALYKNIPIADIASGASVGNERVLNVPLYGEYSMTVYEDFAGYDEIDADILDISVTDNGNGSYTVIFTGKKEGTVSFTETNSGIEYTVTVAPGELVNVSLEAGQSQSFILTDDTVGQDADPDIAEAEITSALYSDILGDCPGSLGTDSSYTGEVVGLENALYTFTGSSGNWVISNTDSEGTQVYLNLNGSSGKYPGGTASTAFGLIAGSQEGTFKLRDTSTGRHLHFYRDGQNIFDRCGNSCGTADEMEIFRPAADGETSGSAIPGYVQVTDASEITDGGKYLITAKVDDTYYALYPSTSTGSTYAHVIKVEPDKECIRLTITGIAPGTTDLMAGGVVYRITVSGYLAPVFNWAEDYTSATAAFTHTDGSSKTVDCTVSSRTEIEAGCTSDGKMIYTASVELKGQTYTDTREAVIPASGHSYGGPVFQWSGDHSACTASVTCSECGDSQTYECEVTSETTEATATTDGATVYTATVTIGETAYSDTFTVTIPATGTDKPSGDTDKPSGDTDKPSGDSDKPAGGNDKPAAGDGADKPSGGNGSGGSDVPKTGDTFGSAFAYLLVLAACGAVIIRMRKYRA